MTQGHKMTGLGRRMKMNALKPFVEAVGEITMLMSSGSGVISVRGGSMGSA